MKIERIWQDPFKPFITSLIWTISTAMYLFLKFSGIGFHHEWLLWITIPLTFTIWVFTNWKIKK